MPSDELLDELTQLLTSQATSQLETLEIAEAQALVCTPGQGSFLEDLIGKREYSRWVEARGNHKHRKTTENQKQAHSEAELVRIIAPGKFLTINQAAEVLGMSTGNLRRHCICGNIEATKIGQRAWIIAETAIEAFKRQYPDTRNKPGRKAANTAANS